MKKPRICASIVNNDLKAIKKVEPLVELFEVRIDLIGDSWSELARQLKKPWIACNRTATEGGKWEGNEAERIRELLKAAELGADIVDLELATENLKEAVLLIKKQTKCLISLHNFKETPSLNSLKEKIQRQLEAGADICKLVTTAQSFEDNLTVLQLIADHPGIRIVSFAMGNLGYASRILCPLVGGEFTYASIGSGMESAPGQITAAELKKLYQMVSE